MGWKREELPAHLRSLVKQAENKQTAKKKNPGAPTEADQKPATKWLQGWREIGDRRIYFRSSWEYNYGCYMEFLKQRGKIAEWEHEPETFWFEAVKRGVRSYLPDFRITENSGKQYFVEVKGWMDPKSVTKLKRMKKYHPDVEIRLVDAAAYKELTHTVSGFIPGWERNKK